MNKMITFKGYNNIITNNIKFDNQGSRLAFISMQLNDEGAKDLTEFRTINEMSLIKNDSDVLTMMYSKLGPMPERLFFNDKSLYLGNELADLHEECGDTYNYKREEKASLKAYTLMASLTKRMMKDATFKVDESFSKVYSELLMFFSESLARNPMQVNEMLQQCVNFGEPLKNTASFFNNFINMNMKKFFKF